MTSAIVKVFGRNSQVREGRMLLDTCATANFITEDFVKQLRLCKTKCEIAIGALNNLTTKANWLVNVSFQSLHSEYTKSLNFFVVPNITDFVPAEPLPLKDINLPKNLALADPTFYKPSKVDMLIGAGPTLSLFSVGQINLSNCHADLHLQKTKLGWVLGGQLVLDKSEAVTGLVTNLQFDLERFWTIEELPQDQNAAPEHTDCEEHFIHNVKRDESGRYIVALPFKTNPNALGDSKTAATRRLHALSRRLASNAELNSDYSNGFQEYIRLGHMSLIKSPSDQGGFFLPHHPVIKTTSDTTKTRIVLDGSMKSSTGLSLNDCLMVGPTIQDDLFTLLIRFRTYRYVVLADIEKMYLQFLVREEDREFQKVLWLKEGEIAEYQLNTLTFGLSSSPFLAIRCLHQLVHDEGHEFPIASKIIKNDMYVDNMITGANTIEEAQQIQTQVTTLLKKACLNMRQWASNDIRILEGVDSKYLDNKFNLSQDCTLKTLGTYWMANKDHFVYDVKIPSLSGKVTKRTIFSEIAKIFDPLGLIGPVTFFAKKIIQDLWKAKVHWDESVPVEIWHRWARFCEQLDSLNSVAINRWVFQADCTEVQLHGFCDASESGYGACIYIRAKNAHNQYTMTLLCSKSRVAPLDKKKFTIPRLELCAARLLARLFKEIQGEFKEIDHETFLWSDSEITLHWINTEPHKLKTFVSNRIKEIQELSNKSAWRHVRSAHNPADCLSRGQLPRDFTNNKIWFNGPSWLINSQEEWPKSSFKPATKNLEFKRVHVLQTKEKIDLCSEFTDFSKLKRIIAICLRLLPKNRVSDPKKSPSLKELKNAESVIMKIVQQDFSREITSLQNNQTINSKSSILTLDPFLDEHGILRVGGRLKNASISYSAKHPIILPKSHHITKLIIRQSHEINLHLGTQGTLYSLRQKYWVIDGRNQIKGIIRSCMKCFKAKPVLSRHKMGDIPKVRITRARPFNSVGVDYCGAFYIKDRKHRSRQKIKIYVAIFVCMVVKAVHIEVVSDLTTQAFIGALRRFISRRGLPSAIYSDNATNFQGAKNEMTEIYSLLQSEDHQKLVSRFANNHNINFHFIPPSAPHFGGLWEAAVKSFKHHLKRVAANALLTFEEFNTLAIEIEAVLNSRPLTPMSSDLNDLIALTPGHFLIGDTLKSLPEHDFLPLPSNRLSSWQLISKIRQDFWKRWCKEYLNELNVRNKWNSSGNEIKTGMLVLLKEDNLPSLQWALGRIHEIQPGTDNITRSVTIKTGKGILKRPVTKIAILPIDDANVTQNN